MQKLLSCYFEDAEAVPPPPKGVVWTTLQFSDRQGWYPLHDHEKLDLKPTRFDDRRIKFLDPLEETPAELRDDISGKYFVKCWSKEGCFVAVEGDRRILLKFSNFGNVVTYDHTERLPTFLKAWKPLVFLANKRLAWIRLTEDIAFVVTCGGSSDALAVAPVDYNGGYLCSYPFSDLALAYGSYAVAGLSSLKASDVEVMPKIETSSGNWGFWLQFYPWGVLKIPKAVDFSLPQALIGVVGMGKKRTALANLFVPPRMHLRVELDGPGSTSRPLTHGKDWVVTARKTSETDIEVWLLMDGQLMRYNHSFDIRINKPEKPATTTSLKFKFTVLKEDGGGGGSSSQRQPPPASNSTAQQQGPLRFTFKPTKEVQVVLAKGCPSEELGHLKSEQLHSVFDAETCQYLVHPVGVKLCNAFTKIAHPIADQPQQQ